MRKTPARIYQDDTEFKIHFECRPGTECNMAIDYTR